MSSDKLNRRDFSKLTMAAFGGIVAGASTVGLNMASAAEDHGQMIKGPHNVCRGLNPSCAHHKGGDNKCAGTGSCATANAHSCASDNACTGQGGCGEAPGENACKGKGQCAVPLKEEAWKKAREHFEEAMKAAGKKFGPAPAK